MKKIVIIFIFVIVVVLGVLPFLMPTEKESLAVGSNLIGALASLLTLLVAILLYSKYGVEKSVIDKQAETVLRFLTELKKTKFLCTWTNGLFQLRLDCLQDKHWKDYKDKKLLFDGGYAEGLNKIWEITDDIFLPVEIAEKIDPLLMKFIIGNQKGENYMTVEIPGYCHKAKDNHFFGLLNGEQMSVKKFIDHWDLVIKSSKEWLRVHSNIFVDLNFEKK